MGGRGSTSASGSAVARARRSLEAIASNPGSSYRSQERARLASVAASIAGTERASGILGSYDAVVIAREYGQRVSPATLGSVAEMRERPLGMSGETFARLSQAVRSLNSSGYSNDEVAAVIRFERYLR